ncbi:hypothetical protein GCM10010441_75390 [Kitasatospora paracochleata]|uniref:Nudix hydrolase domain-containing protein n=1 Tax=Kitasatospora paracochleata TaxID=58354 RepID=A0ABT1J9X3_9ACTN|nr:NUDIX hydrolase [Kitasatospora paracochleata]MCP2314252.1 hypothetical protein [Kitasatospora paracochleata]
MTSSGTGSEPVRPRGCAVLLDDGRLALIRRRRPAGVQLSLPGGVVGDGEDPPDALRRELLDAAVPARARTPGVTGASGRVGARPVVSVSLQGTGHCAVPVRDAHAFATAKVDALRTDLDAAVVSASATDFPAA